MSLRILHITNAGGYGRIQLGGAERGVAELAGALADTRGHEVHVAAPAEYFERQALSEGVARWVFDPYARPVRDLTAVTRRIMPDVVITHLLRGTLTGQVAAALGGVRARVSILHNSLTRTFSDGGVGAGKRIAYRAAFAAVTRTLTSATVAISDANYRDLVDRDRIPPSKVRLIPNWVSARFAVKRASEWRSDVRRELGLAGDAIVLGIFGRVEQQKRQDFALRVVARVPYATLLIVGDGSRTADCAEVSRRVGVAERVRFLGHRPDVERYLAACDITLVPSRYEGFGRVAAESLAVGTPVVASDVDGLRFIYAGMCGHAMTLVDPYDEVAWQNAITCAAACGQDDDRRRQTAARVHDRFSLESAVSAWEALLLDVTA